MKQFIFFALVYLWFAFTFPFAVHAQDAETSFPNYVVIGAFAIQENAVQFAREARRKKFPARFEMNPNRNLYYVYVLSTSDREVAVTEALRLRAETKYFDTWVYSGVLGKMNIVSAPSGSQDVNPLTGERIEHINSGENETVLTGSFPRQPETKSQQNTGRKSGENVSGNEAAGTGQLRQDPRSLSSSGANANTTRIEKTANQSANPSSLAQQQPLHEESYGAPGGQENDGQQPDLPSRNNAKVATVNSTPSLQNNRANSSSPSPANLQSQTVTEKNARQSAQQSNRGGESVTGQQSTVPSNASAQQPLSNRDERQQPTQEQGMVNSKPNAAKENTGNGSKSVISKNGNSKPSQEGLASQQRSSGSTHQPGQPLTGTQQVDISDAAKTEKSGSVSPQQKVSGKSSQLPDASTASKNNEQQNAVTGKTEAEKKALATTKPPVSQGTQKKTVSLPTEEAALPIAPPVRQTTAPLSSEEVVGKNFYFHLYRADNLNTVPGEVEAIDFEKSRKMATYAANEGVKVIMPSGKSKHISFVCQVFGYRKQQQEFDPANPSEDLYLDDKGNLVVPFELIRLQKGDIAIMYNVFFFKDAAVMRPESRYEVNNLLDLLKENPTYKIMIHGHTNGNASGKIIRMDKEGNFYSLSGTKQGFGSAKQLSEERALLIREFLISSGISANRMQVKAWGGKKPIHDKHSARAHENVRVEIEILSE